MADRILTSGKYQVDFQRVGRSTNVVAPLITNVFNANDLADKIAKYASKYLASKGIDVEVYVNGNGAIYAGGRLAGSFTWKKAGA